METPQKLRARTRSRKAHLITGLNTHNTNALKEKLVKEMLELNKQRQEMEISDNGDMDFSMAQTYKEMIDSRRSMLSQLNNSIN